MIRPLILQDLKNKFSWLIFAKRNLILVLAVAFVGAACKPTDFETVRRADQEAVGQRAQLAKYLYLQVIQTRNSRDDVRLRALEGLVDVTTTQTFEYLDAAKAIDLAIQEFGEDPRYDLRIVELRKRGGSIYINNMPNLSKALTMLEPLLARRDSGPEIFNQVGSVQLSLRMFDEAEVSFKKAWDLAIDQKSCGILKSVQLNLIQRNVLERKCDAASRWMDAKLFEGCKPDQFAIESERAHCFELNSEPLKAQKIYEELVSKDPSNSRAHFLLDGLKRRMREKQLN